MLRVNHLICLIFFHLVIASPQINLYFTDQLHDNVLQHNCLYFDLTENGMAREIIPYCMSESPSKWNITENNSHPIFTFAELNRKNITSKQLYQWSAPIDTIERYQLYLNQLSIGHVSAITGAQLFYNCSSPSFGPRCQYVLDIHNPDLSLNEFIHNYYYPNSYEPKSSTCYTHLQCDRRSRSICLDWSEICDGKVDCTNGVDEKDCWQLTTNQCKAGEYRCDNGQCIPYTFANDGFNNFECLDRSDEYGNISLISQYEQSVPTFQNEDIVCSWRKNHPFTSSCVSQRHKNIEQAILSNRFFTTVPEDCILAVRCHLNIPADDNQLCSDLCENETCVTVIKDVCPDIFYYPTVPIAFGHIYFAYTKQYITNWTSTESIPPKYICYNEQLCDGFPSNVTLVSFNGNKCRRLEDFSVSVYLIEGHWYSSYIRLVYSQLGHCNRLMNDNSSVICNRSTMYQCKNSSKCIPNSSVGDGIRDCDYKDDEEQTTINKLCSTDSNMFFRCEINNKCIHRKQVEDGECDCKMDPYGICEDEDLKLNYNKRKITYSTTCDGLIDLLPVTINGESHTDETECSHWPCNNTYTRCDGIWNCPNGADEVDCNPSPLIQCPPYHHICVSSSTNELICLPIARANDGRVDCLGGIDEPALCPLTNRLNEKEFYCQNGASGICIPPNYVCNGLVDCLHGDDEQFCNSIMNKFFRADPSNSNANLNKMIKSQSNLMIDGSDNHCLRGFPVQVILDINKNLSIITCFCPPSYYGDRCQYQNQRVSLTMQLNVPLKSRQTLFVLVISLIDDSNERVIHSYQQLSYLYMRDQHDKFNMYLLYSIRPKDLTKQYAVHIDIYEMMTLYYRGSLLIPLIFPFLPVERLAVKVDIPQITDNVQTCINNQCIHGECVRYLNDTSHSTFCRCESGWSAKYCSIPHICMCATDSLCVGVAANNRSICVCPLKKFGSQCFLINTVCQHNSCQNGGLCIPSDEQSASPDLYTCICLKGFSGKRCEVPDTKNNLIFDNNISLPSHSLVFFHFIHLVNHTSFVHDKRPNIICDNRTAIIRYEPLAFQIVLLELSMSQYYLIVAPKVNNQPSSIARIINPSDRCQSINELFNISIIHMQLIRRIKYYHIPCQNRSLNLSCFFDEVHMCLCEDFGTQCLANCFEFNHRIELHDLDYDRIETECSTDSSSTSSAPSTVSSTSSAAQLTSTTSTTRLTSSASNRSTSSTHSGMSRISACEYFQCLFILLFYLYIHYTQ